jgi:hypothetical protein
MSTLRIIRSGPPDETPALRPEAAAQSNGQDVKTIQPNVSQAALSPAEGSLRLKFKGPQKPKGNVKEDFDLAHVPHSNYQLLEPFREILVSLNLVPSRGANALAWLMLNKITRTNHPNNVSQITAPDDLLAIKLTGKLTGASAVHIMNRDGFIVDSATHIGDGTWVFSKVHEKNSFILFQTESNDGKVNNESLPLKSLKAR